MISIPGVKIIIIITIIIIIKALPYVSATLRDIDAKLSGCVQIPKEHSLLHSDPHGQHHHGLHRLHQGPTKIQFQGDLTF